MADRPTKKFTARMQQSLRKNLPNKAADLILAAAYSRLPKLVGDWKSARGREPRVSELEFYIQGHLEGSLGASKVATAIKALIIKQEEETKHHE